MIDLPEPKEYLPPSAVKKSPAERVAEALNSLLNLFSLPAMFGTHLAIAFSILLLEPDYQFHHQPASPVVVSAGTVIGTSAFVVSSLKPYIFLYNGIILLALFYCIVERHRPEPLKLTTALSLGAVWCDLMVAGSFRDGRVWILLLSILHRLLTSLILVRHWYERRRRRLMKKKQCRSTLEARIRSLEKQNFALKECRDIDCVPFPARAQKKNQVSIFHRSTLSSASSPSSTSRRSKITSRSAAPSSSASYYSAWNSFSGDQTKVNNDRNEKNELSQSPLSLPAQASNPTNTENPEVSLEISFP